MEYPKVDSEVEFVNSWQEEHLGVGICSYDEEEVHPMQSGTNQTKSNLEHQKTQSNNANKGGL